MDDDKLERIAANDTAELMPEVVEVLKEEIERRGLGEGLLAGVETMADGGPAEEEVELFVKRLKSVPCPECGAKGKDNSGIIVRSVMSFILLTTYSAQPKVCCPDCAKRKKLNALIKTVLLGWWGIPVGLFRTPLSLWQTYRDSKQKEGQSEGILLTYVMKDYGYLRAEWGSDEGISQIVRHRNDNPEA
ncbi:hypothetical protein FUAX_11250 [Fulvitalea axinellae]|uniref:Transposase n=1 Tax=Fulvitalea axinellae TaxID=1182444 RepID=A0AAU9CYG7_9BACT|nr:hypothetical protein FUAX_11250 [Fulvitalea axinellae]